MLLFFGRGWFCRCPRFVRRIDGRNSFGFTLIELLAVICIITLLCGLVIGGGRYARERGRSARARTELAVLAAALEEYRRVCGDYPQTNDSAQLLQSLIGRRGPRNAEITIRPLIEIARYVTAEELDPYTNASARLVDPWSQIYRYAYKTQSPWINSGYVLYSPGPDQRDSATLLTGGYVDSSLPDNTDNHYANQP